MQSTGNCYKTMRFDLANEPMINLCYTNFNGWNKKSFSYKRTFLNNYLKNHKYQDEYAPLYCEANGIHCEDKEAMAQELVKFHSECYDKIFHSFEVELISEHFEEEAVNSAEQLYASIRGKKLYDLFGELHGILVHRKHIALYCFTEKGSFLEIFDRFGEKYQTIYRYQFDNESFVSFEGDKDAADIFMGVSLFVLLFKRYAEIRTQLIAPNARRVSLESNEHLMNRAPFMIRQTDCTWFTEYIRLEGFSVRGFWRLQACGPNYSEHRLIYINPFEKKGYHRRAKKERKAA